MSNRLPYAGWASMMLRDAELEHDQDVRAALFSADGRVEHYERYARYCKKHGYQADPAPNNYWKSKIKTHHKVTGYGIGAAGILFWFIGKVIAGSLGPRRY